MQAVLGLPGDPGPWAGQLKGKILGCDPLRPPGTLPLPKPPFPPSPAYSLPTPAASGHLCPHIPLHGPLISTHSTRPFRKFLVQIPATAHVSSSRRLPKSQVIGQPMEQTL